MKRSLAERGVPVVDLGIGSPDMPPAPHVREAFSQALLHPDAFGYPTTQGTGSFREAASTFLSARYGVTTDPVHEILTLMGAQDGLAHLALALINPGDIVLIPDPGYPIYEVSVHLAGGVPYHLPLLAERGYLPDFSEVPAAVLARAKMMILNYPGNPVTAVVEQEFFAQVVDVARRHDIMVVHDAAYIELLFDGAHSPSFLATPGAFDVGIELHSLSKTFHFAGPRLAFAAGNRDILSALQVVKSNIDYGVFRATQAAGEAALMNAEESIAAMRRQYAARRDIFIAALAASGWQLTPPAATMFVWAPIPDGMDSRQFARRLLEQTAVACVPGIGFGAHGEGYARFALVRSAEVLQDAAMRIGQFLSALP
ncbi:MAG: aminotransferase class I/II-fold pyridoxal phosphate-dependent enzyme [Bacilli bacterium]